MGADSEIHWPFAGEHEGRPMAETAVRKNVRVDLNQGEVDVYVPKHNLRSGDGPRLWSHDTSSSQAA